MPTSELELKKIAALAYLEMDDQNTRQLTQDMSAIMDFIVKLRQIDTKAVAPLLHPLDLYQRLRVDEVKESSSVAQLAKIAPLFADDLYLVPKVLETGK